MTTLGQRMRWFFNSPVEEAGRKKAVGLSPRALAGKRARLTEDAGAGKGLYGALWGVAVRPDREVDWRALDLDDRTLERIGTADLVEMMADLSPEISGALWHFIRFCNPGWEATALRPGEETPDETGQARLDAFLDGLGKMHGAVDVVWNMLFATAFLRGAFFAELVLDERGRAPVDLVAVDPQAAEFRQRADPVRGVVWELGQWRDSRWVGLDAPTIGYVPVDPIPGDAPYGRSLVTPAIFSALFLLSLLHDLRRVVAQQGYPRLDLEVQLARLVESIPDEVEGNGEKEAEWVRAVIDEIADAYGRLEPDDAYVHTDVVKVNRPVGTVDADSLGAVDSLIRAVERMATRGLKTMPLLMGSNEAVSETHSNRQWEIHVAGVKALQHLAEQLIERLLTLALQAQGLRSVVRFRFAELRASEALRDAQTEQMEIRNALDKYLSGWISQDEAALAVTGHAADRPQPRYIENIGGEDHIDLGPGDGEERGGGEAWQLRLFREMEMAREQLEKVLNAG